MTHYHHNKTQQDYEEISTATSLYHISIISYCNHPEANNPNLLLLYLYGNRYITRFQIYNLLSYAYPSSAPAANEFINRLVRNRQLQKTTDDIKHQLFDIFTLSHPNGHARAREVFIEEISQIIQIRNPFFYGYTSSLLSPEPNSAGHSVEHYADVFEKHIASKSHPQSMKHMLATRDAYIALLRHIPPTVLQGYYPEAEFSLGRIRLRKQSSLFRKADIRSDAVFGLATKTMGSLERHNSNDVQLICVEQDTLHQSSSVLSDKLKRYARELIFPRLEQHDAPPMLIFSILSTVHFPKASKTAGTRRRDRDYVDALYGYGLLYCCHVQIPSEKVPLKDFLTGFQRFHNRNPYFERYAKFLKANLERYGEELPVADLRKRYNELSKYAKNMNPQWDSSYTMDSYNKRRSTIFNTMAQAADIETIALSGVSFCATNNLSPCTLLSLFPEFSGVRDSLPRLPGHPNFLRGAHYTPFYLHTLPSGYKIRFRGAYQNTGTVVHIIENVSADYCARIRLKELFEQEPSLTVSCIILFHILDCSDDSIKDLLRKPNPSQRKNIYIIQYLDKEGGGITYKPAMALERYMGSI